MASTCRELTQRIRIELVRRCDNFKSEDWEKFLVTGRDEMASSPEIIVQNPAIDNER